MGTPSWAGLETRHWLGPACWYSSLVLAVASIFSGGQQNMIIEQLKDNDVLKCHHRTFWGPRSGSRWARVLFAWEAPFIFLHYSMILFLVGLCSHIVSPVVFEMEYNNNTKVGAPILYSCPTLILAQLMIFYLTTLGFSALVYVTCSRLVHNSVIAEPQVQNRPRP
jgi:hypothetical protein